MTSGGFRSCCLLELGGTVKKSSSNISVTTLVAKFLTLSRGFCLQRQGVSDGKCCSTAHVMCEVVVEIAPCLLRWAAGMMRRLVRVSRIVAIYTYLYIRRGVIFGSTKAMLEKRKSRDMHILILPGFQHHECRFPVLSLHCEFSHREPANENEHEHDQKTECEEIRTTLSCQLMWIIPR